MKKFYFLITVVLFSFFFSQPNLAADDWQIETGRHFVVYHRGASSAYLNQLLSRAERHYRNITGDLGFQRFDFWLWDQRCEIYLYPDRESYLQEEGAISWSRAHVNVIEKQIKTYAGQENFFDTILPHELAHIIFREFIGFERQIPLWLDEGVAILAESDIERNLLFAQRLVAEGKYIPLRQLSDIRNYHSIKPEVFYSQSASIVNFLLERYGRHNFVNFCRYLRDNDNWKDALRRAYRINSLDELEERWKNYLN